jgi:hypothetical protein
MSPQTRLSHLAGARHWQVRFLLVLPEVQRYARCCFRHLPPEARDEAIAAVTARAFCDFGVLAKQHKLHKVYLGRFVSLSVRRVGAGRLVGVNQNARDLYCRQPRRLQSLHPWDPSEGIWREQAVPDRRVTPSAQAIFNLDFETWLQQWPRRHRHIINALAAGHRNFEVAKRFRIACSQVSRCRRNYQRSWEQFQGLAQAA